jgi:hypothetical protein
MLRQVLPNVAQMTGFANCRWLVLVGCHWIGSSPDCQADYWLDYPACCRADHWIGYWTGYWVGHWIGYCWIGHLNGPF